jgi:hypothetical protein
MKKNKKTFHKDRVATAAYLMGWQDCSTQILNIIKQELYRKPKVGKILFAEFGGWLTDQFLWHYPDADLVHKKFTALFKGTRKDGRSLLS